MSGMVSEGPAARIVAAAVATVEVTDALGRRIRLRRPGILEQLRLFKALGPALAENAPYMGLAMAVAAVVEVDGVPLPVPASEALLENAVSRLGDAGMAAVSAGLQKMQAGDGGESAGN